MALPASVIEAAHAVPIERIIYEHDIRLRGSRVERSGPCPICGGHDRFSINIRKNVFFCRGCDKGGDVISLVQFLEGISFREACAKLTGEPLDRDHQRQPKPKPAPNVIESVEDYERRQRDKARYLWRISQPAAGTPTETYLRGRGINDIPATVRFLPPAAPEHHPAMTVPFGIPTEIEPGILDITADAINACQLTLLNPDGSGKAEAKPNKLTIASPGDLPMVLAPINDLLGLAICEGVEDALSVHQATGLGAWASGGASFMPKLAAATPDYVEAVAICAHDDEAGQRGARALADILSARDIEIFIEGLLP